MVPQDYYVILGVSRSESPSGIRARSRDLVRTLHPDVAGARSTSAFHRCSHESTDGDDDMKAMLQCIEQRLATLKESRTAASDRLASHGARRSTDRAEAVAVSGSRRSTGLGLPGSGTARRAVRHRRLAFGSRADRPDATRATGRPRPSPIRKLSRRWAVRPPPPNPDEARPGGAGRTFVATGMRLAPHLRSAGLLEPERRETVMARTKNGQGRDAIALLKADHDKIRGLLGELEETTERATGKREKLLAAIEQELKLHTKIEEEIFYPAFRDSAKKKDDKDLYYEAIEEHHVVDLVLPEIKKTAVDSDEFSAKAKVLKDLVEHHAEEEESEMFPRARKLMDHDELWRLGEELAKAKESGQKNSLFGKVSKLVS
jgi:hemerythrin-like domain-containing protein